MNLIPTRLTLPLISAGLMTLAACGGGGASSTSEPAAAQPTETSVKFSGVVATGAPLTGASVSIHDATGALLCDTTVDDAGSYACDLGTAPKAPFVIVARRDEMSLVSMFAQATSGTVNVTPLTNLIASQLSSNGDPLQLLSDVTASPATVSADRLDAMVTALMQLIKPVVDALGASGNPLTGSFLADGTGHDRLLDALQVTVRPTGTESNIEITVKSQPSTDDALPVALNFKSSDSSLPSLPASISLGALAGTNIAGLMADLLNRMKVCYALPLADRVTDASNPGSTVLADACKSMFTGNDPATFLSNGSRVGPTGAFSGMFRAGGTGVTFDRPNFEFFRANGDLVFTYRWIDAAGNVDNDQMVARDDNGTLKLIGNQYAYEGRVRAYVQNRELVNSSSFSHVDTGYNIYIGNRVDGGGNPVFAKVLVTSPRGNVITYKPSAGLSYMVAVTPANLLTASPVIRLNGKYLNAATTGHPKDKETALFYADPTVYTDEVIKQIPDQGVWTLEFFHADTNQANVIQRYRTTSRAPTLAEAMAMPFASLTDTARSELVAASSATGLVSWSAAPNGTTPNVANLRTSSGGDWWQVGAGALSPVSVSVYGRAPTVGGVTGARFNDTLGIPSSARKATIRCSAQTVNDTHCDASLVDQYAQGANWNSFEMWARSPRQVEMSKMIGVFKIN